MPDEDDRPDELNELVERALDVEAEVAAVDDVEPGTVAALT